MAMNLSDYFVLLMGLPLRYFVVASVFYFMFYVWKRTDWQHLKIQQKFPTNKMILSEILHSMLSMVIFAVVIIGIINIAKSGVTRMYADIDDYGWLYLVFSVILLIVLHDFFFYFAHRLMHYKRFYTVHRRHHLSLNPTPWAAFSFSPVEAVLEIIWLPIVVMIFPFHRMAIISWSLFMIVMNVIGHLGYEIFPRNFLQRPLGKILLSSTHHNLHHSKVKTNYGLYFTFWDKILNTEYKDYEKEYQAVKSRSPVSFRANP